MRAIEDPHPSYDSTPVLRGIDLEVAEGKVAGVIGKNGAGKTTLMKSVIGLLEPDSGMVRHLNVLRFNLYVDTFIPKKLKS